MYQSVHCTLAVNGVDPPDGLAFTDEAGVSVLGVDLASFRFTMFNSTTLKIQFGFIFQTKLLHVLYVTQLAREPYPKRKVLVLRFIFFR